MPTVSFRLTSALLRTSLHFALNLDIGSVRVAFIRLAVVLSKIDCGISEEKLDIIRGISHRQKLANLSTYGNSWNGACLVTVILRCKLEPQFRFRIPELIDCYQ